MELLEALEPLKDKKYRERYKEIYASVKMSMDELEKNRTNIETEGELTFEDGMIAFNCTARISNNKIIVKPDESIIGKIHVNLKSKYVVEVQFASKSVTKTVQSKSLWIAVDE